MVLLAGFSSCSDNDDMQMPDNAKKNVTLKLDLNSPSTYADGPSATNTHANLVGGYIYFTDGAGKIYNTIEMVATVTPGTGEVSISDLATGATISDIDGNVTSVHVAGNVTNTFNIQTTMGAVNALKLGFEGQGNVEEVSLSGTANLIPSGSNYTANVNIKSVVSRLELMKIEYDGSAITLPADKITAFDITGIFVNKAYKSMTMGGTVSDLLYYGPTKAGDYTAANFRSLADVPTPPAVLGDGFPAKTPTGTAEVWGYQFFPVDGTSSVLPELVIRLENIAGGSFVEPTQWLTVGKFKNSTSGDEITQFEANKIYKIANIKFDNDNLSPNPSTSKKKVTVTVTVLDWDTVSVEPIL